jgi:DNA-binding transcriptional regulator GbsR (MarR family)
VSNSIRELQGWNLVKLVHIAGDRRDHFETSTHVWELFRTIVRERQRREIAPTVAVLNELLADPALGRDPAEAKLRMRETLEFLETLTAWSDEMLKLDTETLTKVLKLGAKIKKLLGRDAAAAAKSGPTYLPGS